MKEKIASDIFLGAMIGFLVPAIFQIRMIVDDVQRNGWYSAEKSDQLGHSRFHREMSVTKYITRSRINQVTGTPIDTYVLKGSNNVIRGNYINEAAHKEALSYISDRCEEVEELKVTFEGQVLGSIITVKDSGCLSWR